jgi:hypothetical protein
MKNLIIVFITAVLSLIPIQESRGEERFVGDIYLAGTKQLIFRQTNKRFKKGDDFIMRHTYTFPDGKIAVQEDVTFRKRSFHNYKVEFSDAKCGCLLERKDDKVVFRFTRGDTDKTGEANYSSSIVMGPTLTPFVHINWKSLTEGKTVYFLLPAMSLQKVVRFRLYKDDSSKWARKGVMVLKMAPSNVFLRIFVDPVDLVYDTSNKRILEIHGKSLLRRKVNGRTENPVVDIYYRYGN